MISFKQLTKKKVPVKGSEGLIIDCRKCGTPSIDDAECLRCIGDSIVRFGEPDRITLRSNVVKEYTQETVELLRRISDAFCRTSVGKDCKECRDCVLSRESLENEKWADFSLDNIDEIIDRLGKVYLDCPDCQDCISSAERYFMILRGKMEDITNEAVKAAYRIVGA